MDLKNDLSSSEDGFYFDTVYDEIQRISNTISGTGSDESDEDDDDVVGVRTRKIRVIDSEGKGKSMIAYRRNNNVILAWKDKRIVTLLSNYYSAEMSTVGRILRHGVRTVISKPNAIINYTQFMGGVDLADQYCSSYCFMRKSLKWWRKLFFWGLEICLINSYILYKETKRQRNERPLSHLQFRKDLVNNMRGDFRQTRERTSNSTSDPDEVRLNGKLHVILTGTKKDCKVCSTRNKPGGRHETTYYCDTCPSKPRMHLGECYIAYHTKRHYR